MVEISFNQEERQRLLDYFLISQEDLNNIAMAHKAIFVSFDSFLDKLYEHFLKFPQTAAFFPDQETIARVKAAQRRHYSQLFSGKIDNELFRSIWQIGQVHDRLGLEPRWYMGCYVFFLTHSIKAIIEAFGKQSSEIFPGFAKILCLDIALVWESYYQARVAKIAAAHGELERRHRELQGIYNLAMKALNERAELIQTYEKEIADLKKQAEELSAKKEN